MVQRAAMSLVVMGCVLTGGGGSPTAQGGSPPDAGMLHSYRLARATVERALEALGGDAAIARAGGLALDGEGELDLGTLLQGRRPFEGDTHPILERIAILPEADRAVHEERAPINPDASSWERTDYRAGGTYRIDMETSRASWSRPASRRRLERTIPHLLLKEVLENASSLRHLGTATEDGMAREAVGWQFPEGPPVTLHFDPKSGLLRGVESIADLPGRGDATIRWRFQQYTNVPGLGLYPTGYTIHVDDERLREVRWTRRTAAPAGGVLDAPAGVKLPPPTPFEPAQGAGPGGGGTPADRPEFDVRDLAPGVHLLANLRTGFHMLFVDFGDYVAAVDAPSGWWELQELPARDWARSPSPALGERYVAAIRHRLGDKPIRYVVLSHHHSDHAGGVRAFVEQGATVVGSALTRPVVERTLAGSLSLAGRDPAPAPALKYEVVEKATTFRHGEMEMRIIDVGPNPHSEGMLAVWLPGPRILYVSDLFDPWSQRSSPPRQRLPVMRWFVQWLDRSGLNPDRIYAIHGSARVTEENLEAIRRGMTEGG